MLCFYTRWILQYNSFNEPHEKPDFCLKQSMSKSWKPLDLNTYFVVAVVQSLNQSVMSDSLWLHGLQHTWLSCPSPSSGACSNTCPLSWWCHPTISSSVGPLSSHLQSFPASLSFPMSQFFTSGGQTIGASASALVLPMNIQDWFPLGRTSWISLLSKGL